MIEYDVVIIGAGPAGLTAGLYAGRSRLKTLIVEKAMAGGQVLLTELIENFPGIAQMRSFDWVEDLKKQVTALEGVALREETAVSRVVRKDKGFSVELVTRGKKEDQVCRAVIVATGALPRRLDIPGEKELTGKGVSYCAICDAPLFRGKDVVVVGGGNTALEEALFLARFAAKVTLVHRRAAFRAVAVIEERVRAEEKIALCLEAVPVAVEGAQRVEGLKVKNVRTDKLEVLRCDGVFIFTGSVPDTGFLGALVDKEEDGSLRADEAMVTSCAGVFACGDCRLRPLYQIVTACAEGALAAHSVDKYLEGEGL